MLSVATLSSWRASRMLLACPNCHRQYDVGAHEPGAKIRCLCGNVCVVARPRARQSLYPEAFAVRVAGRLWRERQ